MRFLRVNRIALIAAGILSSALLAAVAADLKLPKGAHKDDFMGWQNSIRLKARKVEVVITPAVGARILEFSHKGDNIIYQVPASAGKTLLTDPNLDVGGYQDDVGPELNLVPEHKELWNGPWRSQPLGPYSLRFTSQPDPNLGVKMERDIVMDPHSGDLGIIQRMHASGDKGASFCHWDRTLCKGGGFAFFPLNPKSAFPAKWSIRKTEDGKFMYDGKAPLHSNVKILDGVLVAKADGQAAKIGSDSDAGWIAYARGRLLFVKYFPHYSDAKYSDAGNSVEVYFDERFAELEVLSPHVQISPQAFYEFPEKWTLIPLDKEVATFEDARALVYKIPPSPF